MGNSELQPITSWAPIVGRWTIENGTVTYDGPEEGAANPFGICLSNARFNEGEIRVKVELSTNGDVGRVLFGYSPQNGSYWTAGLGGYERAYVLSEFDSHGWRPTSVLGSRANLIPNKAYEVETKLFGQRVYLAVDSVRVIEYVLEKPMTSDQVGVFAWGEGKVKFADLAVSPVPGKAFVVMKFSEPYKQLYSEVIKPVAREFNLEAYHVGEVYVPGLILNDIVQGIVEAKVVIAEVTPSNENVFYELGYGHALSKPTILLAERGKQPPFDVAGYRHVFYDNTIGGKKEITEGLRKHLASIMHEEWNQGRLTSDDQQLVTEN
jgi:hypothetical protein